MGKDISQLEHKQVEALSELGAHLRECRETQRLSLEQVATRTMIQPRLLRAIETGKLNELPEAVYIQGFIKHYGDALDLDGAELAKAFPLEASFRSRPSAWKDSPAAQLRPIHLYIAYVLLIVLAISGLSHLMNRSNGWATSQSDEKPSAPFSVEGNRSRSSASNSSLRNSLRTATTDPSLLAKSVRVDITLTSQSWLRVVVDGKTDFQGILPEGTHRTWTANAEVKVRAGNAGGVMLAYNSGNPKPMGEPGAVKEVIFSASQQAEQPESTETASLR